MMLGIIFCINFNIKKKSWTNDLTFSCSDLIFFVSMHLFIELDSYGLYNSSSGSTSFVSIAFSVVFDSTGSSVLNSSTLSSSSSSLC